MTVAIFWMCGSARMEISSGCRPVCLTNTRPRLRSPTSRAAPNLRVAKFTPSRNTVIPPPKIFPGLLSLKISRWRKPLHQENEGSNGIPVPPPDLSGLMQYQNNKKYPTVVGYFRLSFKLLVFGDLLPAVLQCRVRGCQAGDWDTEGRAGDVVIADHVAPL